MYSASKLNLFEDCRKKYWYTHVAEAIRVPAPPRKYFEKGNYFHYIFQHFPNAPPNDYNKFVISTVDDIKEYRQQIREILKNDNKLKSFLLNTEAERERWFYIGDDFNVYENKYENPMLFQGVIDYHFIDDKVMKIIDWKTGKVYKQKTDTQLKLYALWGFLAYPYIDSIETSYYYIEHGYETSHIFHRNELKDIQQSFDEQINRIEEEKEFPRNVTRFCNFCDYLEPCKPFNLNLEKKNG